MLEHTGSLNGITKTVSSLDSSFVVFLAWLVALISFVFPVDSARLNAHFIDLTALPSFVLVPFAL